MLYYWGSVDRHLSEPHLGPPAPSLWDTSIQYRADVSMECAKQCGGDGTVSKAVGDCFEQCINAVKDANRR